MGEGEFMVTINREASGIVNLSLCLQYILGL